MLTVARPLIGGTFAEPATELPQWFNVPLFRQYPYLLPGLIAGTLGFSAAIVSVTFLREVMRYIFECALL